MDVRLGPVTLHVDSDPVSAPGWRDFRALQRVLYVLRVVDAVLRPIARTLASYRTHWPAPDRRLLVSSLTQREASTTEGGADAMSPHQEGVHLVAQEGPYAASTSHLPVLQVSAGIGTGRAASAPSPCNCTMQARMRNPGQKLRGRASSSLPQPPARPNSTSQHAAAPRPSGARRQAGTTSGGRRARPRSLGQGDRS